MNADLFRATVEKYKILRHVKTKEQLRAYTNCGSSTTFRNWLNDPNLMPIGEWENLMNALNVPYDERFEILRRKNEKKNHGVSFRDCNSERPSQRTST